VDCLVQYCRHHAIDTGTIGTKNPPRQLLRAVDESVRAQLAEQGGYHGLWNLAGKGAHLVDRVARFLPAALRSVALAADEEPGAPGPGDPWQFRSLGPTLRFQGGECSHLIVGPDPAPGGAATPGVAHVHLPQLTRTYTLFEAG